jgi:HB1, ASXL, restriction endonuclease HTH domain
MAKKIKTADQTTTETAPAKAPTKTKAPAKKAKPAKEKKLSALDAAAKILGETSQPMTTNEMIEAMSKKGYWSSPNGQTPQATLYSAIIREIGKKGKESRFAKSERGKFERTKVA